MRDPNDPISVIRRNLTCVEVVKDVASLGEYSGSRCPHEVGDVVGHLEAWVRSTNRLPHLLTKDDELISSHGSEGRRISQFETGRVTRLGFVHFQIPSPRFHGVFVV